jgi:uncharacterized iron-regulated membrane protein
MKLRKLAFTLHRFVGVMVGILLVVIGLTGSILVFHTEIDHSLHGQMLQVVPAGDRIPLKSAVDIVQAAYPELQPQAITLPETAEGAYEIAATSAKDEWIYIYLNPYTGDILGSKQWGRTLITLIYDFHLTLLAGEVGRIVVGTCGLMLLLLTITGLMQWTGWKKLVTGFKIRWQAPAYILNYDLHQVGGFLSAAFLILTASTGATLIFYEQFEPAAYWLTRTPTPTIPTSTIVAGKSAIPIDEILQTANAILPEAKATFINLPQKPNAVFRITKKFPQELHHSGRTRLYFDQYSGKALLIENALTAPLAKHMINLMLPVHAGTYGGLVTRIIYVFIGLIPTLLFVTGWKMWRRGKWAKAQRKEAVQSVSRT